MKLCLYLLMLGIGLGNLAYGQRSITGTVTDSKTGQPVALVNLTPDAGSLGTSTDQDGKFSMVVSRFPVNIRFSHIAYEAKILTLSKYPEKPVQVKLEPRVESIGEVVVEGGKYIQIMKRENFFVDEYEFDQDKIWVVGYANKSILQPQLILLTLDGRVIEKVPVRGRTTLYKDAFGRIHLIDKESITLIDYTDKRIRIGEPKKFNGWEQNLFDLQLVLGKSGIFKWVYNNGTYCEYAVVDFRDTAAAVIHKSYDRELFRGEDQAKTFRHSRIPTIVMGAFGMGGAAYRGVAQFDPSDAFTARAQEQVDYRPLITHIYRFRNNYLIFEDRGCHLWKYDVSFTDPEHFRIDAPKDAKNTDLLQDPVTGSLYLYYTLSGVGELAGVDPLTGAILSTRQLENFAWIENLKVYNDRIWFKHQNVNGTALMNLYSTEIGGN